MEERIVSHLDLRAILRRVEKPGRYVGGEYGSLAKEGPGLLRVAISYPDLYEIGMSNTSIRLIYRLLNALEGVACERVFAPAVDFEAELRACGLPLCSLESGRPLRAFDVVGFSVGYELTFTNLLNILDLGGIPLLRAERGPADPVVVAGGPAVTNPVPFGAVIDAVFVGEIEGEGIELFAQLSALKARGGGREDLLELLAGQPFVWTADKGAPVRRALWRGFGEPGQAPRSGGGPPGGPVPGVAVPPGLSRAPEGAIGFPVPSLRTVQDHGVVEIMRGCPNGCRFCHAGIFYRPFRMKDPAAIVAEVDEQVRRYGYREVTLASLSTSDYPGLAALVRQLNARYADQRVSFSLPSLRISSVTLELLSEVSSVRKSGLTFAVETPLPRWQAGINKPVSGGRLVELLKEARERGWRQAKFYFMVGLPPAQGQDEVGPILELLAELRAQVRLELAVNVSAFIPKPHTPFQWAPQLGESEALERILRVKRSAGRGVQVRYHSPFLSVLEGVVSRGDERAGRLFLEAFRRGARFDAWEDRVDRPLWREVFADSGWDVEGETCRERQLEERLPWREIRLGVTQGFLRQEYTRALAGEETSACCASCTHACGVCREDTRVREVDPSWDSNPEAAVPERSTDPSMLTAVAAAPEASGRPAKPAGEPRRVLFSFRKQGRAVYLGHLDLMGVFERALLRAGYRAVFTEGFNPKPRLEFAQPLSLGIASEAEVARVEVADFRTEAEFEDDLNRALPEGVVVWRVRATPPLERGQKKLSLMAAYRGSDYRLAASDPEGRVALARLAAALEARRAGGAAVAAVEAQGRREPSRAGTDDGPLPPVQLLERSDTHLVLRLVSAGAGPTGVLRLAAELGLPDPLRAGLEVTRLSLLAAAPGTRPGLQAAPQDYFDLEL